jgi:hypothetical protein
MTLPTKNDTPTVLPGHEAASLLIEKKTTVIWQKYSTIPTFF